MVRHRMSLHQFYSRLLAELPEDPPHPLSQTSVHRLLSVFRAEHNVIFAVPFHVRLAFPLSHVDLLSFELPGSLKGDRLSHAGTAEPLRVAPPEAVAYLLELSLWAGLRTAASAQRPPCKEVEL